MIPKEGIEAIERFLIMVDQVNENQIEHDIGEAIEAAPHIRSLLEEIKVLQAVKDHMLSCRELLNVPGNEVLYDKIDELVDMQSFWKEENFNLREKVVELEKGFQTPVQDIPLEAERIARDVVIQLWLNTHHHVHPHFINEVWELIRDHKFLKEENYNLREKIVHLEKLWDETGPEPSTLEEIIAFQKKELDVLRVNRNERDELIVENSNLKERIVNLEEKIRATDAVIHAMQQRVREYTIREAQAIETFGDEVERLKNQLKESIEQGDKWEARNEELLETILNQEKRIMDKEQEIRIGVEAFVGMKEKVEGLEKETQELATDRYRLQQQNEALKELIEKKDFCLDRLLNCLCIIQGNPSDLNIGYWIEDIKHVLKVDVLTDDKLPIADNALTSPSVSKAGEPSL